MSVTKAFAKQNVGAQLRLADDTETRVAIKHGKRTIAYVAVARDLWGQLMVDRFNCHEDLMETLRAAEKQIDAYREALIQAEEDLGNGTDPEDARVRVYLALREKPYVGDTVRAAISRASA